jgi:hypothetical protein
MGKKVYLLDRSGAETADRCGMSYYWQRLHGRRGIVPVNKAEALEVGGEIHEDLQTIATMEDISEQAITTFVNDGLAEALSGVGPDSQVAHELAYRRYGWAAAFALFIEPRIRASYDTTKVEGELILDRGDLWVPVTPDRVLRHKVNGLGVYREYKSTISASSKWLRSWHKAPQLHLGIAALREDGTDIAYAQVMGLMKGQVRDGRLAHPYTWGYRNSGSGAWTHDYAKARGAAWVPAPVWNYPGGLVQWVKVCGEEVALAQFPHTEPVFLNEKLLNHFITRWTAQMKQWGSVAELCRQNPEARAIFFPHRTNQCEPAFGDPCPYRWACWNATVGADPLASGYYVEREPHHEVEIMLENRRDS